MSKRLMMNIKGISGYLIPRFIFTSSLNSVLLEIKNKSQNELEHIKTRLNYYNNIKEHFTLHCDPASAKDVLKIASNNGTNTIASGLFRDTSYSYDFYKYSKYFKKSLIAKKDFGDCIKNLPHTISKSRPISASNVIMKLNSKRHFAFVKDGLSFDKKDDRCVFRGACYQANRRIFIKQFFNHQRVNAGDTSKNIEELKQFQNGSLSKQEHLKYKFIISLEGNDVATNLKWIMASNSIALSPKLRYETWFMEGKLVPNEHFALLSDDFSDLFDVMDNLLSNDKLAKQIIKNANDYAKIFFDEKLETLLNILVLAKYFYYSNQIKLDDFVVDLFK